MKYNSKVRLLDDVRGERDSLIALIRDIPARRRCEAGVWGDGWTLCDLLAHLAEWHRLLLGWYRDGRRGVTPQLPAAGYKWNETPRLNRDIWAKHRDRGFEDVLADFDTSYREVLELLEGLSESELLEPGHFAWTGGNALVTYAGANTASHYRFAGKVLKRWLRRSPHRGKA